MNKKTIKHSIIFVVSIVMLGFFLNFFGRNTFLLNGMVKQLVDTAKGSEGIEVLDSRSNYGKLVGNGNGIEYYGAVLVKASSEEDVQKVVAELKEDYDVIRYREQSDKVVDAEYLPGVYYMVEDYVFEQSVDSLYSIYFITTHEDSNLLDMKGDSVKKSL